MKAAIVDATGKALWRYATYKSNPEAQNEFAKTVIKAADALGAERLNGCTILLDAGAANLSDVMDALPDGSASAAAKLPMVKRNG